MGIFAQNLAKHTKMNETITIKDTTANPGPLGLVAFGMTTILLNLHNAGLFEMNTMIMAMGIFIGGMIQIFVGMMEWKKNNLFGLMAFTSYGAFWLSLVGLMILTKLGWGEASSKPAMAWYLTVWGIFSLALFFVAKRASWALTLVFATVVLLFALLAAANFTESHAIHTLAGYVGIVCGSLALYTGIAELYVVVFGKEILPLG